MKMLIGIIIIAHGLVHGILAAAPDPAAVEPKPGKFFTALERSWLLPQIGLGTEGIQWVGIVLVVLSTAGFVLAGAGVLGAGGLNASWRVISVVASLFSLILLISFWHRWLPVGVAIDLLILIGLMVSRWTPIDLLGV